MRANPYIGLIQERVDGFVHVPHLLRTVHAVFTIPDGQHRLVVIQNIVEGCL